MNKHVKLNCNFQGGAEEIKIPFWEFLFEKQEQVLPLSVSNWFQEWDGDYRHKPLIVQSQRRMHFPNNIIKKKTNSFSKIVSDFLVTKTR